MAEPSQSKKIMAVVVTLLAVALMAGLSVGAGLFTKGKPPTTSASMESHDHSQDAAPVATTEPEATVELPVSTGTSEAAMAGISGTVDLDAIKVPRIMGSADAPVRLVEYYSLTCSHCAHFHRDTFPQLKTKYIDTGLVSIEFREFPLNAAALDAAIIARCLPADRYDAYTSILLKTQDDWITKPDYIISLKQNAKLAGLGDEQVDACLADPAVKQFIAQGVKDATAKWKIESTPTFIVNDGKETIKGAMPLYEFERVFRVVTDGKVGALEKPAEETKPDVETPAPAATE